ncbi:MULTISPECIES: rod shape-determining protein RodA [Dermacoccus]|uniref:peptidoglycan glycosyltransferase n=2 Tax=Dermacoccus TaxID=57495 RepID=A0ABN2B7T4_9MICO|nr:rod shape-determining protein RodA [Dermacoccus abyssi]
MRDLAHLDLGLLVAAAGLSLLGILLTWSATTATSGSSFAVRGALNVAVGMALAFAVLRLDARTLRAAVPLAYLAGVLGLLAVLSPLGSTINGSRSWIELPGFSVQPAEIAKVALGLALASALADTDQVRGALARRDVRVGLGLAAVPLALIMAQPDLGSALVVTAMAVSAFAVAGLRARVFAWLFAAAVAVAVLAFTTPLLAQYQRDRLLAFWRPEADPSGIGYQVAQVKLAIGSGGWFGQGLFEGRSTQGGFIPFQYTDFVFSVAGEELGFVGALGIVALEMFVVVRTLVIGIRSRDAFGRILCGAIAGWFLFQSVENIGMNLGLMPVTGVPLPFVSYGGSSMFSCWIAVGLVGNVHAASRRRIS